LSASPYLTSYDPVTGKELWKIECLSGEIGSSPSYSDGIVFAANKFSQLSAVDLASKKIIWYYEDNLPDASSPAVANGLLILPTPNGVVSCLDAKTGKVIWENKFETGFYSSPVICGNKVFLIDRTGICRIFKFDRSFERINDIDMKEKVVATPAFYKNSLVVRTEKNLYAIGKK
jgi:outer membrane protein assembly factor BamB